MPEWWWVQKFSLLRWRFARKFQSVPAAAAAFVRRSNGWEHRRSGGGCARCQLAKRRGFRRKTRRVGGGGQGRAVLGGFRALFFLFRGIPPCLDRAPPFSFLVALM